MINASGLLPAPVVATHNPLARQPEEEERAKLQEQPLPPVQESVATERGGERRRSALDAEEQQASARHDGGPGSLIDSYA